MKIRRPPAIAAWLIARNSPLAGDLLEEFQRGKSRGWFWRQALVAVAAGWGHNVRVSQLYLKAVFIGLAAQAVVAVALWRFHLMPLPGHVYWRPLAFFLAVGALNSLGRRKVAVPASANLRRLLAESGDIELRRHTAIIRLVTFETFTLWLGMYCVMGDSTLGALLGGVTTPIFVEMAHVVFRRPRITPASGKRP